MPNRRDSSCTLTVYRKYAKMCNCNTHTHTHRSLESSRWVSSHPPCFPLDINRWWEVGRGGVTVLVEGSGVRTWAVLLCCSLFSLCWKEKNSEKKATAVLCLIKFQLLEDWFPEQEAAERRGQMGGWLAGGYEDVGDSSFSILCVAGGCLSCKLEALCLHR